MSALQSAQLTAELSAKFPGIDVSKLREVLGVFFWQWFVTHQKDALVRRKILIFSVTILVRDMFPLWVLLFGNNPIPRAGE